MDQIVLNVIFCGKCPLQFENKVEYDMHLSLVHKEPKNKEWCEIEKNEKGPEIADQTNISQSNENIGFSQTSKTKSNI